MTYQLVPIAEVTPDPGNLREKIGDISELTKSIRAEGVIQPLIVRPASDNPDEDPGYVVVAGHRRLAAARRAKVTEIPVVVQDLDGAGVTKVMLIENMQREDLTPAEEAQGYFRLVEEEGLSQKEAARATGKSESHVSRRLKLVELPKAVLADVGESLTLEEAEDLASAPPQIVAEIQEMASSETEWGERLGYRRAAAAVAGRQKKEQALEAIAPAVEKLRSLEVEVLGADEPLQAGWGRPEEIPNSWRTAEELGLPVKEHRAEECHVAAITQRYEKIQLVEWCKKPSRHGARGKSELKVPDAQAIYDQRQKDREARKAEKEAKEARWEQYRIAALTRQTLGDQVYLFARALINSAHHDTLREAGQALQPDRVVRTGGELKGSIDWPETWRKWAEEVGDRKAALHLLLVSLDPANPDPRWSQYRRGRGKDATPDATGFLE